MPIARVQMPDGRVARLEVPEGTTPQQVEEFVFEQQNAARSSNPTEGNDFFQNMAIGAGKLVADSIRGGKQMLGIGDQDALRDEIAESRKLDAPLMKTAGGVVGNVAPALLTAAIPGANTVTGAAAIGAGLGALQPVTADESRAQNAAVGGALGAGGQKVGQVVGGALTRRLSGRSAESAALESQNAVRDAALRGGQEAGYVVPPSQVNPSLANRALEGFSGKIQTGQAVSVRNQKVTNDLARQALGISDNTPITPEVLQGIRAQAGEAYEALRGAGTITADKQFGADLARVTQKFEGAAKDFPELAKNEIGDIVASVNKTSFSADSAIDAISILRERATAAFAKGDKSLGNAYRQTSQAMEDAIERKLIESGDQKLLKGFQEARKIIAKTYSVEKALNPSGNVNAQKLAGQLKKGKPLTDELRTAASFGSMFPKAAQNVDQIGSTPGVSPLDFVAALGMSTVSPGAGAAALVARPTIRSMMLSGPYQSRLSPNYGPSMGDQLTEQVVKNDRLPNTLRSLFPAGYFATKD